MINNVSEKRIEQYLVREVAQRGGKAYKFTSPANKGVPDRLVLTGVNDNPVIFVEVKKSTGKLAIIQNFEIKRLKRLHAKVFIVYSIEDVDNLIANIYKGD